MFNQTQPARDAFTFSLGGMSAIAPFVAPPIVADDRLNKVRQVPGPKTRSWPCDHRHAILANCA